MTPLVEKHALQAAMVLALPLSFTVALHTIAAGPGFIGPTPVVPADLDSHVRYLSGIFLGMLLGYVSCVPAVERKGSRLTLLVALTMLGGLARLWSLVDVGAPSVGYRVGLALELLVAPAILLWQRRVARRLDRAEGVAQPNI